MDTAFSQDTLTPRTFKHVHILAWEIRLVELLPGDGEQEIACKIKVMPRKDAKMAFYTNQMPSYIALSYAWGNPRDVIPIT